MTDTPPPIITRAADRITLSGVRQVAVWSDGTVAAVPDQRIVNNTGSAALGGPLTVIVRWSSEQLPPTSTPTAPQTAPLDYYPPPSPTVQVRAVLSDPGPIEQWSVTFTLPPGRSVVAWSMGTNFTDRMGGWVIVRNECVADVDGDGWVTFVDRDKYLEAFDAGDRLIADVDDGSGTGLCDQAVGVEDLVYWLNQYDAVCR